MRLEVKWFVRVMLCYKGTLGERSKLVDSTSFYTREYSEADDLVLDTDDGDEFIASIVSVY